MRRVKALILSYLILTGLWLVLSEVTRNEFIIGSLVSATISLIFSSRLAILENVKLNPKALFCSIKFIFVFLRELFKSAIDVAIRVLSPSLPINPGIVKVRTKLHSKLGRIVLANSITLTPGTMTVEAKGEYLYIHWIDIKSDDIESATVAIVSTFEKHLEVMYG
ncbi:MAG: Na+/H+ antiporter subunit E [Candidatus Cloacimonetes bacterium]|nr:Na+/H+ antiporter subunit E [Candidatus Cloacimonadota bacterium]